VANRAAGKGYENEVYYSNIQFKFCPIENIHAMRSSLQKLLESKRKRPLISIPRKRICRICFLLACEMKNPTMNQYISALDSSSWLQHIKAVLDGAVFIARVNSNENQTAKC